jgi:hypothetical protein
MDNKILRVLDPRGQPSGIFGRTVAVDAPMMDILEPFSQPEVSLESHSMAPRLDSLDGKTVYLVDTGFVGGYDFLEEAQKWFSRNRPSVKTILRRKEGTLFSDAPQLWKEIKEKGDAVVFGVGG